MQIEDHSGLRADGDEDVTIPLNGEVYRALPKDSVPAGVLLDAVGATHGVDFGLITRAETGATLTDKERLQAAAQTQSAAGRAVKFLQNVLYEESAGRWAEAMRASRDDPRRITLPQVNAVYRSLLDHYGGRPTSAPQSSPNGLGATGPTQTGVSTGGAPPVQ